MTKSHRNVTKSHISIILTFIEKMFAHLNFLYVVLLINTSSLIKSTFGVFLLFRILMIKESILFVRTKSEEILKLSFYVTCLEFVTHIFNILVVTKYRI